MIPLAYVVAMMGFALSLGYALAVLVGKAPDLRNTALRGTCPSCGKDVHIIDLDAEHVDLVVDAGRRA